MESAMTNIVVHLSDAASRCSRLAALLGDSICRATIARGTRRALNRLPDAVLKDIGLARGDIPFVVGKLESKYLEPDRDVLDRFDWNAVWRNATILRLPDAVFRLALVAAATVSAAFVLSSAVLA
jgi:uncharacterized protein YjiS (DUF1127 family)